MVLGTIANYFWMCGVVRALGVVHAATMRLQSKDLRILRCRT